MYKLKYMPCINQICFLQNKKIEKSLSCQFWFVLYVFAQTCYRPGNNSSDYKKFSTRDLQQNFPGEFHFDLLIIKFKTYFVQGQNLQIQNEITWN